MTRNRRSPPLAVLVLGALLCFGLGLLVSRRAEAPATAPAVAPATAPAASTARAPSAATPAGSAKEPQILIDPSRVELLPDASLRLDLPPLPDAGAP